jgi:hypothetical protein
MLNMAARKEAIESAERESVSDESSDYSSSDRSSDSDLDQYGLMAELKEA